MKATKFFAALPAIALVLAACSSTPAAVAPSAAAATVARATAAPTTAAPTVAAVIYKADLKSTNQNPPIQGAEASCAGTVTITVTGGSAKFDAAITACPAGTPINIAHIHEEVAGKNGAVVLNTGLTAGQLVLATGAASPTFTVPIDAALATRIAANPAGFYFNMHSTANAGGVIRGQLVKS